MITLETHLSLANSLVQNLSFFNALSDKDRADLSASLINDVTKDGEITLRTLRTYLDSIANAQSSSTWVEHIMKEHAKSFRESVSYYYMLRIRSERESNIVPAMESLINKYS